MAEAADKRRPMAERIAGLDVKSSFRDIRDGIGGSRRDQLAITDQDLAAALGMMHAKDEAGNRLVKKVVVLALETYYGSSLRHEDALRAAWGDESERGGDPPDERIRNRIACALAVRHFAGAAAPDLSEWSQLLSEKPEWFGKRVNVILAWLGDLRDTGLIELRKKMAEPRAPLDSQKSRA